MWESREHHQLGCGREQGAPTGMWKSGEHQLGVAGSINWGVEERGAPTESSREHHMGCGRVGSINWDVGEWGAPTGRAENITWDVGSPQESLEACL